jgi:hypothetical protein
MAPEPAMVHAMSNSLWSNWRFPPGKVLYTGTIWAAIAHSNKHELLFGVPIAIEQLESVTGVVLDTGFRFS